MHVLVFWQGGVQLHLDLYLVALERKLVAEGFFLLEADVEDELLGEGVLVVEVLVHYGVLVHQQVGAWDVVLDHVLGRGQDDVDEGDGVGLLDLDRQDAVGRRVRHLPQHDRLRAALDRQLPGVPPKVSAVVEGHLDQARFCFVFPDEGDALVWL